MPAISGWSSGIVPQPISVGITGTPELGELLQQLGRVGVDDAAAGHDQRALGGVEHVHAFSACLRVAAGL
jgi:hypothetical protein